MVGFLLFHLVRLHLTLTRVVFELAIVIHLTCKSRYLTLTRVVFESGETAVSVRQAVQFNFNKSCI